MLRGYDTSHHQSDKVFNEYLNIADFMIIKATEGKTYVDPKFKQRATQIIDKLCGFYHYARPENNTIYEEVDNFVDVITPYLNSDCLLFLDWENESLNHPFEWALDWCRLVEDSTGIKPIIYASASVIQKHKDEYELWWTAHYNSNCDRGCNHDGVEEVLTQYTSKPIDCDVFHGTINDWKKLSGNDPIMSTEVIATWTDDNYKYEVNRYGI